MKLKLLLMMLLIIITGCQNSHQLTGWVLPSTTGNRSVTLRGGVTDANDSGPMSSTIENGICLDISEGNLQQLGFYSGYRAGALLSDFKTDIGNGFLDGLIQRFYVGIGVNAFIRGDPDYGFVIRGGTLYAITPDGSVCVAIELSKGDSAVSNVRPEAEEEALFVGLRGEGLKF